MELADGDPGLQEHLDHRAVAIRAGQRQRRHELGPAGCQDDPEGKPALAAAPELRYVDAISDALRVLMRRDETVVLLGQEGAECVIEGDAQRRLARNGGDDPERAAALTVERVERRKDAAEAEKP
mgnify:CR=1 FL=1